VVLEVLFGTNLVNSVATMTKAGSPELHGETLYRPKIRP
jgi:hypothetical protein